MSFSAINSSCYFISYQVAGLQHILYEIQTNPDTFMKTPEGDKELFKMWCDDFKLIEYDSEINSLLANCPRVRALYQEMVIIGSTFYS